MRDDPTFELEDDPTPAGQASAPPPTLVIVRRERGWATRLAGPLLIVALALVVLAYRARTPDWRGLRLPAWAALEPGPPAPAPGPAAPASPPLIVKVRGPATSLDSAPLAPTLDPERPEPTGPRRVEAIAAPPPGPITGPSADLAPNRPLPAPGGPAPPAAPWPTGPLNPPGPDATEQALAEIRRESERRHAEMVDLEVVKVRVDRLDQERARQKKAARLALMLQNNARMAAEFRDRLRPIVKAKGHRGGREISQLCDRYPADPAPDPSLLPSVWTNLGRRQRIKQLRAQGFAEPAILVHLAQLEAINYAARNGPKDFDEAMARAAYYLLEVAPTPARDDF